MKEIHVMIVDDDDDREFLKAAFGRQVSSPRFTEHVNGGQAIDYLTGMKNSGGLTVYPHIVFLDLHMPCKSGYHILLDIKQDAALRHIPVMMLSASLLLKDHSRCLAAGCEAFYIKPMSIDEYDATVAHALSYFSTEYI